MSSIFEFAEKFLVQVNGACQRGQLTAPARNFVRRGLPVWVGLSSIAHVTLRLSNSQQEFVKAAGSPEQMSARRVSSLRG